MPYRAGARHGLRGAQPSYDLEPPGRGPGGSRDPLCNLRLPAGGSRLSPGLREEMRDQRGVACVCCVSARMRARRRSAVRYHTRRCPRDRPQARRPRPQAHLADTQSARRRLCGSRARGTRSPDFSASPPTGAARARASTRSAPRDRRRPPPPAAPCRSRARRAPQRVAEQNRSGPALFRIARRRHHSARQFDRDRQRKIDALRLARRT